MHELNFPVRKDLGSCFRYLDGIIFLQTKVQLGEVGVRLSVLTRQLETLNGHVEQLNISLDDLIAGE